MAPSQNKHFQTKNFPFAHQPEWQFDDQLCLADEPDELHSWFGIVSLFSLSLRLEMSTMSIVKLYTQCNHELRSNVHQIKIIPSTMLWDLK